MKKLKVVISVLMCLVFTVVPCFSVYGAVECAEEYFEFASPLQRMESNGDFDFNIYTHVKSDTFTATSNTLTLKIWAQVQNIAYAGTPNEYYASRDVVYKVEVKKNSFFGGTVDTFYFPADQIWKTVTVNVKSGSSYYLDLWMYSDNTGTGIHIDGTGNVSNIKLK